MSIPEVVAKRSRRSGPRLSEGSSFFFVHSLRADSIVRSSRGIDTGLGVCEFFLRKEKVHGTSRGSTPPAITGCGLRPLDIVGSVKPFKGFTWFILSFGTHPSNQKSQALGLLDYDKDVALFHRLARRDLDLGHFTFLGRFEFVLHLHRFDHDHTLLKGHGVARLDKNVDDPPGHHRAKLDPSGRLRTRRASAAKRSPGSINQRDTRRTAARGHDYLVAVGDNVQVEAPIVDQDREGGGSDASDVDVELIRV